MDLRKIKKLIELIDETGVNEIEIHEGEESVRVSKGNNQPQMQHISVPATQMVTPNTVAAPPLHIPAPAQAETAPATEISGHQVKSPMVGTLYRQSAPDKPPLVEVGQKVEIGDTLCIVEAMKMFNEIESDKAGVIQACLVENGEPVEYDQPLFIIQ